MNIKDNVINNLNAVIQALNNTNVCGKNNLANLSGSIYSLEVTVEALKELEFIEPKDNEE